MAAKNEGRAELVILGASIGGGFLIRKLISTGTYRKFNTTVIDRNEYMEWFVSIDRYICDESLVDGHMVRAKDYFEKNKLEQYNMKFVQGTVTNVTSDGCESGGLVEYNSSPVGSNSNDIARLLVPYRFLVIATGTQYGHPVKSDQRQKADRITELKEWSGRLSSANEVVVVGGGSVGVEIVGAIAYKFKQDTSKKIHLVTRSRVLLERLPPNASEYALKALKHLKVTVHFNKDADSLKSEISPDALFLPSITRINTSFLDNKTFRGSLAVNGAIKVNSFMQVDTFRNVFALGDCCVTPLNEEKGILSVNQLGQVVWTNLIHKLERERLVTMPPRIQFIQAITIGQEDGLVVANYKLMKTGSEIPKMKAESADNFGHLDKELAMLNKMNKVVSILDCLSSVCCCCPISSGYREAALRKKGAGGKSQDPDTEKITPKSI